MGGRQAGGTGPPGKQRCGHSAESLVEREQPGPRAASFLAASTTQEASEPQAWAEQTLGLGFPSDEISRPSSSSVVSSSSELSLNSAYAAAIPDCLSGVSFPFNSQK